MGALQGLPDLNTIRGEEGRALSTCPWTRNPSSTAFTIACMQSVHACAVGASCLLGLTPGKGYDRYCSRPSMVLACWDLGWATTYPQGVMLQ